MSKIKGDYRFIDKDPVVDVIRGELQRFSTHNEIPKDVLARVSAESGVGISTIRNWVSGETKRPLSLTSRFVLQSLGVEIKYVRSDGTSIRDPSPQMKSAAEIRKIKLRDKELSEERAAK